ncbi:acetate kinase, partial [Vibrio sp. M60_M31a]
KFMVETILAAKPELSENLQAAIGHRVVHGGEKSHLSSALITDDVPSGIEDSRNTSTFWITQHTSSVSKQPKIFFPALKNVAVFDTAFHQTMPEESLPIRSSIQPAQQRARHVRRYGMHGTSHLFITREVAGLTEQAS